MDYTLCNYVVTVYRNRGGKVEQAFLTNAFYTMEDGICWHDGSPVRKFLLVIPGKVSLIPGDRVVLGFGPTEVCWDSFIPANVPNLVEVGRVRYFRGLDGEICHTEAEHLWN